MSPPELGPRLLGTAAAVACLLAVSAVPAAPQAYVPSVSFHPVVLSEADIGYPELLLLQPRGFDVLSASSPSVVHARMTAYREFEEGLRRRTVGSAAAGTPAGRRSSKRQVLAGLGEKLQGMPGAALVRHGQILWRRLEDTTDFAVEGYRVRLRVDEALEGKLALKVQKQLR